MPQIVTAADYVAIIVVVVPCLFIMALLPVIVDAREVRRSRQPAPVVASRHLPQAAEEYAARAGQPTRE